MQNIITIKIVVLLLFIVACNKSVKPKDENNTFNQNTGFALSDKKILIFNAKQTNKLVPIEEILQFDFRLSSKRPILDSISIFVHGKKINNFSNPVNNIQINTSDLGLGKKTIKITGFFNDKSRQDTYYEYYIISNAKPEQYSYKVIKTYQHDSYAYTQGLIYDNGILYEGTGKSGFSSLRKIDFTKNNILQTVNLDNNVFGEGITILNNKIYQLTWKSNKGYIYNKSNLKLLNEFNYSTEGWGLTTDGEYLILSDGSNILYYLDTTYFIEEKRVEVFDNYGMVNMLNELEYIKGEIYANIYGQDYIVVIDPETGKVNARINTESIRPSDVPKDLEHAFNGIAFSGKSLFVTGKYWPFIYEIEITK